MKTRDIILVVLTSILMFVLGGFVVYQVVSPEGNKEEEKLSNNSESEFEVIKKLENNDTRLYINGKKVFRVCEEDEFGCVMRFDEVSSVKVYKNYVLVEEGFASDWTVGIYDKEAKIIYSGWLNNGYNEDEYKNGIYTNWELLVNKDQEYEYIQEIVVDLTGNAPEIKKTKEKINKDDCKNFENSKYEELSDKDKLIFNRVCCFNGCI